VLFTYRGLLGTDAADFLLDELGEGVGIALGDMKVCPCSDNGMCSDCIAGIAAETLRELLDAERV
jgi:hypothetical protein